MSARTNRARARLVFLNLLKCNPQGVAELARLISSMVRRMRILLPTCLSMEFEDLVRGMGLSRAPYNITRTTEQNAQ